MLSVHQELEEDPMRRTISHGAVRQAAHLLALACLTTAVSAGDTQVLLASQGAAYDEFGGNHGTYGGSMALDGDWLAVGSERRKVSGLFNAGVVTLYSRSGDGWVEDQEIAAGVPQHSAYFGCAVALRGSTLLVGSRGHNAGVGIFQGAVHVFELISGAWHERQVLTASDGKGPDQFGSAVTLDDGRAVVGAPGWSTGSASFVGAAYVFEEQDGAWSERQRLVPDGAVAKELVGTSVALEDDRLLLGAPRWYAIGDQPSGSAYPYHLEGDQWVAEAPLAGPAGSGSHDDWFGLSVAMVGDLALVGAPNRRVRGYPFQGVVVAYRRYAGCWEQEQVLTSPDPTANGDGFGTSLGTDGMVLAVGASFGSPAFSNWAGKAHVFRRTPWGWQPTHTLTAPVPQASARFGTSVVAAGHCVVSSAPFTNVGGEINQGLAAAFDLRVLEPDHDLR